MKHRIAMSAHIGSLVVFLLAIDAPMAFLRFIMTGEMLGGRIILSADTMLASIIVIVGALLSYTLLGVLARWRTQQPTKTLPKRRYAAIQ